MLASASPRRRELLSLLGFPFDVLPVHIDESLERAPLGEALERLSSRKADVCAGLLDKPSLILAADTVVSLNGRPMGKPADLPDAERMLRALSGAQAEVLTGVCLLDTSCGKRSAFHERTRVWFDLMADGDIAQLMRGDDVLDRAGAFSIQGLAGGYVKKIEGDYLSVVGLPLCRVRSALRRDFGMI